MTEQPSFDDVLNILQEIRTQLAGTADHELRDTLDRLEERLKLIVERRINVIEVSQHINQVAEYATIIGVKTELHVDPESGAQINQLLELLLAKLSEQQLASQVFVSSTWRDLYQYRRELARHVSQWAEYKFITYEPSDLASDRLLPSHLRRIEQSDIFIGIYAKRYGSIDSDLKISFTEQELRLARDHFMRCFCFLSHPKVSDFKMHPPERPTIPELIKKPELPEFSDFYPTFTGLSWHLKNLWNWVANKPDLQTLKDQAYDEYHKKIEAANEFYQRRIDRRQALIDQMHRDYAMKCSEYKRQLFGQAELRKYIRQNFRYHKFNESSNLITQIDTVLQQYEDLKITGLDPGDIQERWKKWTAHRQRELERRVLDFRPLLLCPLERELTPTNGGNQESEEDSLEEGSEHRTLDNLWHTFLKNEWHQAVQKLSEQVYQFASNVPDQDKIQVTPPPDLPPDELFNQNYEEEIVSQLRKWCGLHQTAYRAAKRQLDDVFQPVDQWGKVTLELRAFIQRGGEDPENDWYIQIKRLVNQIRQLTGRSLRSPWITEAIEPPSALDETLIHEDNDGLVEAVLVWCTQQIEKQYEARCQIETAIQPVREACDHWNKAISNLFNEIKQPRFGRCLQVIGRSGSGKTHTVARFLNYAVEDGICPLYLTKPDELIEDLEALICRTARLKLPKAVSGPKWRSLEELSYFLGGQTAEQFPPVRLVVIIDELEKWIDQDSSLQRKVRTLISKYSHLHNLYWVLTLSEFAYGRVAAHTDFWSKYGFLPINYQINLPGWLSLDDYNEQIQIWESIFHHLHSEERVQVFYQKLEPSSSRILNTPFIAWIIAELWQEDDDLPHELLSLNFINWVERFWDLRLNELAQGLQDEIGGDSLEGELRLVVKRIAARFAGWGEYEFNPRLLPAQLGQQDQNLTSLSEKEIANRLVSALIEKGFLLPLHKKGQIEKKVKLEILPFWRYWGGSWLVEVLATKEYNSNFTKNVLQKWFAQLDVDTITGLLEFTILHLDKVGNGDKSHPPNQDAASCAQIVTRFVIQSRKEFRSSIWRIAVNASPVYQKNLGNVLEAESLIELDNQEELYQYMFFLKNARLQIKEAGIPPHKRLRLLRPHFSDIDEAGQFNYFVSLVKHILVDWVGGEEIARSLANLRGVESFWNPNRSLDEFRGKTLADWAFDLMCSLVSAYGDLAWHTLIQWIQVMLLELSQIFGEAQTSFIQNKRTDERLDERDLFWALLIARVCQSAVYEKGLDSFKWLEAQGWFRWIDQYPRLHPGITDQWLEKSVELHQNIWRMMAEQYTKAIGEWYRMSNVEEKREFTLLAEILVGLGSGEEKAFAIFLIYHTAPEYNPRNKLYIRLWQLLEALYEDNSPEVQRVWQRNNGNNKQMEFYNIQKEHFESGFRNLN